MPEAVCVDCADIWPASLERRWQLRRHYGPGGMEAVDPRDPEAVRRRGGRAGRASTSVAPSGRRGAVGHRRRVRLVHPPRRPDRATSLPDAWRVPLIVRLLPSPDRAPQAAREADRAGVVRGPRLRRATRARGARNRTMGSTSRRRSWSGLRAPRCSTRSPPSPGGRRRLVDQLAGLALSLHALPTDDWPERTARRIAGGPAPRACRVASSPSSTGPTLADALRRARGPVGRRHVGAAGGVPRRLPPAQRRGRRRSSGGDRLDRRRARSARGRRGPHAPPLPHRRHRRRRPGRARRPAVRRAAPGPALPTHLRGERAPRCRRAAHLGGAARRPRLGPGGDAPRRRLRREPRARRRAGSRSASGTSSSARSSDAWPLD